jgi:hypothetical protein
MKTLILFALIFCTASFGFSTYMCPLKGCDCGRICTRTFDCVHGQKKKHHRTKSIKAFPSTHESLLIENGYANAEGLPRYETMKDVQHAVKSSELIPLAAYTGVVLSSRLPAARTAARPEVVTFLYTVGAAHAQFSPHPIIVDSAVRPVAVQKRLHLRNAAPWRGERASPHETGATIDLKRQGRADDAWMVSYLTVQQEAGRVHVIQEKNCWHIFVRRTQ